MSTDLAVIFDVDGVLVDSYNAHYQSWQLLCRERGLEMTHGQFIATFGRTSREIIKELWPDRITTEAAVAEHDDRKEELYRGLLTSDFLALDGAVELIDDLHQAGFPLAVGSSGPPENVGLVLDALDRRDVFGGVVTGDDVSRGKPDPQVFLLGAERIGASPANCVVIEDAPVGVTAAHAAGMKCVAVVSTGRVREKLDAADLIVDTLRELNADIIRGLISS
ncbi:MAG: HAD family phosphatase [Planctomycetes bacterium]|nr:HAD family phosphatase [Planctomycetota bacterium]MBL7041866.1 HAD family phosphatase [Pirellulaceae bacterium]